jgi:heat shock protein HslJ
VKPTDLDDPTPLEPDADVLARVHTRSRSLPPRRRAQRAVSVAVGVLVVLLAAGIALARVDTGGSDVSGPAPAATSATIPATTTTALAEGAVSVEALVGPWQPDTIAGYAGLLPRTRGLVPELRFADNGTWSGSDGCNEITGSYELGAGGTFTFAVLGSTDVGCTEGFPPIPESLAAATRVTLVNGRLAFFSGAHGIAQYVRENVFTRVELPSTTLESGSQVTATVVVENYTDRVIHATRCGNYFHVVLGTADTHAAIGWESCLQQFTIPVGVSRYRVPVSTPLPPGEYQARLYQRGNAVPTGPTINVQVVAAR